MLQQPNDPAFEGEDLHVPASFAPTKKVSYLGRNFRIRLRVARWYIFKPKIPIWENF
jgi:hypothetical protein